MLNQETKDKFVTLGFDVSKLEDAVKSETDQSLDVPTLKTEDEFSKLISEDDKKTFGNNRFNEGKGAFSEIYAKELKKKHNIDIDGKDLDKVIEAIMDNKVKELGGKPEEWANEKKTLQQKILDADKNLLDKTAEFQLKLSNIDNVNEVSSLIPDKTIIPKEDLVTLFNNRYRIAKEDGRTIIYKGSEKLQDSRLEPLALKDVVSSFIDEGKYLTVEGMGGGAGGKGGGSAKFKTLIEFEDYCEKQEPKINPLSEEGQKLLKEKKDEAVSSEDFFNSKA